MYTIEDKLNLDAVKCFSYVFKLGICMRKPHNIDRYLKLSVTSKLQKQLSGVTFNFDLEY